MANAPDSETVALEAHYGALGTDLLGSSASWLAFAKNYALAYKAGFKAYKKTVDFIPSINKHIFDAAVALVSAATIETGAPLLASFGASSMRKLLFDRLVFEVAERNMERTVRALDWLSNNAAARFFIGKVADGVSSKGGPVITEKLSDFLIRSGSWGEMQLGG